MVLGIMKFVELIWYFLERRGFELYIDLVHRMIWGHLVLDQTYHILLVAMHIVLPLGLVVFAYMGRNWSRIILGIWLIQSLTLEVLGLVNITSESLRYGRNFPFHWTMTLAFVASIVYVFVAYINLFRKRTRIYFKFLRHPEVPICLGCGYELKGTLEAGKTSCAECGEVFVPVVPLVI